MTCAELIERVQIAGGVLALNGERIRVRLPEDAAHLLGELMTRKSEVLRLLREREESDSYWPPESLDAKQRFGQPHAKLFPFIGRKVRTPGGAGTLLQVFADCVTVLLDSELVRCSFFPPSEIEPVSPK